MAQGRRPTGVEGAGREGMGFAKTALLCFGALCVALVTKKGREAQGFLLKITLTFSSTAIDPHPAAC